MLCVLTRRILGVALILGATMAVSCATVDPQTIVPRMPDLMAARDGTFRGEFTVMPVYSRVEVVVKDHRITAFTILEHRTGLGAKAETLAAEVVSRQTVALDGIAGATTSSKAILKAGEVALVQSIETP